MVLADATWKTGDAGLAARARRAAVRALDHRDAHYCVLSSEEARAFGSSWGMASERVHFTPFHWVLDEREVEEVQAGAAACSQEAIRCATTRR